MFVVQEEKIDDKQFKFCRNGSNKLLLGALLFFVVVILKAQQNNY